MPLTAATVSPDAALGALADAVREAKADDLLAPVTVVVPTNACGVMTRRWLGRKGGVVGIDMVTLNRLAELIAGPGLAAAGRSPVSAPVVDIAIGKVLTERPGSFAGVGDHPSTIVALRELHREIRLAGDEALTALAAASRRGAEAVRVSTGVDRYLAADWYDEADLYIGATAAVGAAPPPRLRQVVVYFPPELSGRSGVFLRALATQIPVHVLVEVTGDTALDTDAHALIERLGADPTPIPTPHRARQATDEDPTITSPMSAPSLIVSTTDADDEVRIALRSVVDAARAGTPLERMAVLWPTHEPYARLVEHHLDAADIGWNGRPGTTLSERLVCRFLLDLLDLDHRGLRRRDLFSLLADVPARDADGTHLPSASWERLSRDAGVARDADWTPRLAAFADDARWRDEAAQLSQFVEGLRSSLGDRNAPRRWWDWADWCGEQLDRWIGRPTLERLPDSEYAAWESLTSALDRLRHLDPVGDPVARYRFRSTLAAELDSMLPRRGRIGDGVTIGPLEGAVGLDLDVAIVLGAAEGSLPPIPRSDPLVSEADRAAAGLSGPEARTLRLHRRLLAVLATTDTIITVPRGDLRSTAEREPSRWIAPWIDTDDGETVASHAAGLVATTFPASASEHRLRTRLGHVVAGGAIAEASDAADDRVLQRAVRLAAARRSDAFTEFDGNLSSVDVPRIDDAISPTRLERWTKCPHAYFMRHLLRLHPIDEPDDDVTVTPLERGSLHHEALDRFHRAVIAGELPQPTSHGWADVHREALVRFFAESADESEQRGRTGRPATWANERRIMLADVLGWLERDGDEAADRSIRVVASEYRFDATDDVRLALADGRSISLTGAVDRIDIGGDGSLWVTDHKTGGDYYSKLNEADPTLGATAFQLPSYALAARAMTGDHDAPVHAEYGMLGKGKYRRRGYDLTDEVFQRVAADAGAVVAGIEAGFFPNRPVRPGFRMHIECEYCEPDHLGTAARWNEWTRKRHDPAIAAWFAPDTNVVGDGPGR